MRATGRSEVISRHCTKQSDRQQEVRQDSKEQESATRLDPYEWPPIRLASKIADRLGPEQWLGTIVDSMPHSVSSLNRKREFVRGA